jgi:DNA-binding GntR family transcriptional regulator
MRLSDQHLAPVSIVDRVTNSVRRSILAGHLKPGSSFSITELASSLGVSTIPVREALQRLEAQGLIVRRYARTAFVAPLTKDELREVYRMRILVECDTARVAAAMLTEEALGELERHLESMRGLLPNDENFWAHHSRFHMLLLAPALTPFRERIVQQLWHAAERYVRLVYDGVGFGDQSNQHEHHYSLYEAARAHSGSKLKARLAQHYEENVARMLRGLNSIAQ